MSSENIELKKAGLKVTHPRVRVLQILENSTPHHLSAEDVYKALLDAGEDVGLATIYRVLTQFETAGLVERHNFASGHAVFELARGNHHDHMLCITCGQVTEFTNAIIEREQEKVAKNLGFTLKDHSLYLYGECLDKKCPHKKPT